MLCKWVYKGYLKLLVDEIRVDGNKVCVRGSHAVLAVAIAETKLGTRSKLPVTARVPSFGSIWLPITDSNE
jgi:hypothetical protein